MGVVFEECWKENFWMLRVVFVNLVLELRLYILLNLKLFNYRVLSVEKKVVVVLYFLKDIGFLRMIVNSFGIVFNIVLVVVNEVC